MDEFSTYVFKENEVKTNNLRVNKERPYYIGFLIMLIGIILYFLDSEYTAHFMAAGYVTLIIGQIILSGRVPSIGYRPLTLKLRKDALLIGTEKIEIKNRNDVRITLNGYKGQGINHPLGFYQTYNGNDNLMRIRYGDKEAEFKFVLESETHRDQLIKFCNENGFQI